MGTNAIAVNDADFSAEVEKAEVPVLVDFWANWCAPCRAIAPMVEDLSVSLQGKLKVVKIDCDVAKETSQKFNVRSIPMLILFKDGVEIERTQVTTKTRVMALLEKHGIV